MHDTADLAASIENLKLRAAVADFLCVEARLMDDNQYSQWLALYADPCTYWIPSNDQDYDPASHVSILYGGRPMLENHVQRLVDGHAFAQSPPSRLSRVVANIELRDEADQDQVMHVRATFQITEIRRHQQRLHAGRSEYELLRSGNGFLIRSKKIILAGLDEPQENITFLL